jgi:ornithine cyclodeaminase
LGSNSGTVAAGLEQMASCLGVRRAEVRRVKVLVLTHADVERLMPVPACIEVMAQALEALARGDVYQPLRMVIRPPKAPGVLGLMPAVLTESGKKPVYAVKVVSIFPDNPARGKDAHQGSVLLLDGQTGELKALMNASAITAIRTAAVSGLATRLLARTDAGDLAIVGAGVQARTHLLAMAAVRPLRRVRVVSRRLQSAQALAGEMAGRVGCAIEAVATIAEAVRGADLVVTATNSAEPLVALSMVASGAHLNLVGASLPHAREVDTATMAAAAVFVDRRESTLAEAGDYRLAAAEGAIGPEHIRAELGEVLAGQRPGRRSPEEITLFKSLGLAVEDLASAEYLYQRAEEMGVGTWVEA